MKDDKVRRERAKWMARRFAELGVEIPPDVAMRAHTMTRKERRIAVALARRAK